MLFFVLIGPTVVVLCLVMFFSRGQDAFVYLALLFVVLSLPTEIATVPLLFLKPEQVAAGGGRIRVTRPGAPFSRPIDFTLERDRIGRCVYRRNPITTTFRFIDTDGRLCSPRVTTMLTCSELEEILSNVDLTLEV
jgi:hypothetical protein